MLRILDPRAIKTQTLLALDRQRPRVRAEVDRIAPAPLLFATDRTIAELVRNRRMTACRKANRAAAAGSTGFGRPGMSFWPLKGRSGQRSVARKVRGGP